jgi:maltooligosyltrehalose synthase
VLPRWTTGLGDGIVIADGAWGDTVVVMPGSSRDAPFSASAGEAAHAWHNALTGEIVPASERLDVATVFQSVPFALLEMSKPIGA